MSAAALLGAGAAAAAVLGLWEALAALEPSSLMRLGRRLWAPWRTAGDAARMPDDRERRRLAWLSAVVLAAAGWMLAGVAGGLLAATGGPLAGVGVMRARERRHAARLREGASEAARALADALGAGHSVRGAVSVAAGTLAGAVGRELEATAAALELGDGTEAAVERLRARARCPAWDVLTAALLLQRDAGGDLVSLLRRLAASLEAAGRLEAEARTATAQARFTAWLVIALPLCAAGLAELGSPGLMRGLLAHPLSSMLALTAAGLQIVAVICVRVIARRPRMA